ncbi:Detected protein of unknown function [Hibiscus syriacus]|uniref:Retrovirus-related Pol polyprotein from transposon TNT 1-94-like beta-barrel domain-containing protein n=1 Tax=Hibiscus syriacus TaxID=106335 RepID=A0A6A2ZNG2_HIBSY|nr:Detected protein of unknown function [Hibiscus syriacus]
MPVNKPPFFNGANYAYWKNRMMMKPNEDIKATTDKFSTIVNGLKSYGEIISNEKLVRKDTKGEGEEEKHWSSSQIHKNESDSDEDDDDDDKEMTLFAKRFRKMMRPYRGRKFKQNEGLKNEPKEKDSIICYECKSRGMSNMIATMKRKGQSKNKHKAHVATWSDEEGSDEEEQKVANLCLMTFGEDSKEKKHCYKARETNPNSWYIDSGCSRHMTGDKNRFSEFNAKNEGEMTFGDDSKGHIEGIINRNEVRHDVEEPSSKEEQKMRSHDPLENPTIEEREVSYPREYNYVKDGEIIDELMGDLSFFLGLQIKQRKDDIFINQAIYVKDMLKKFGLENGKPHDTPMNYSTKLDLDEEGKIYLKDTPSLGLWYLRDSSFSLHAFSDADYGGCKLDRKSTPESAAEMQSPSRHSYVESQYHFKTSEYCQRAMMVDSLKWMDRVPICCVCGSKSEDFVDNVSLVMHAFTSRRHRVEHLGLHKALCLLMGWDSMTVSNCLWTPKALACAEVLAMKEDLVVWPPVVILHNSSIGTTISDDRIIVSIEEIEAFLRGMGFGRGISKGYKMQRDSITCMPRTSMGGLSSCESIATAKRKKTPLNKVEDVLYGYLGVAGDMDKLDFETKSHSVVKSKKEIYSIADQWE